MRIAIIGSGISGLTCAYLLSRQHQITLFEADDRIGGHTHTVDVEWQGRRYAVDTGFIVYNDWTYPNFIRLMDQLGVASRPTEMSFSVHDPACGQEYKGHTLNSLFARRRNLLSPGFWGMLLDILRFNRQATADLLAHRIDATTRLGDYLRDRGYGRRFTEHYIVPMGSAIWSMSPAGMMEFPLQFFVRFCHNHGLLSVNQRPQWRVIEGGSRGYIDPLCADFRQHIHLDCPVRRVSRDHEGVSVHSRRGIERFDKVVFACHSDQALALLETPSAAEADVLGALAYAHNEVLLHTDTRLLPQRQKAWASWNYRLGGPLQAPAALTYNMNILQGLDAPVTFCVSLNQSEFVDPAKVLARFDYAHPQYSLAGIAAQARQENLQGRQHSYFCGAYWANGFHEDGVVSALAVAKHFGETL
ncbi:FAD-dependent oxidoreductase [Pseudomonas sp. SWRI92]|uniref:FAD-dependent oxidoreductase n=1 Tax=Pseudomonas marvdashtae TaxID=2745500 RepID=A0A923JNU3_9PSED|nr:MULTISPECIES: FAD-dependent oxidoreductase [Pseudomonas]MBC3372621.1 FAD-dependent oxidoreductase [Pseudomonas sp. SWRI92]MBV4551823.1 FAD-dependent oxidoreductase [Pseudomonas marvdashtae]